MRLKNWRKCASARPEYTAVSVLHGMGRLQREFWAPNPDQKQRGRNQLAIEPSPQEFDLERFGAKTLDPSAFIPLLLDSDAMSSSSDI